MMSITKKSDNTKSKFGRKKIHCHSGRIRTLWGWQIQTDKPWGGSDFRDRKPWWQRERELQPLHGAWV